MITIFGNVLAKNMADYRGKNCCYNFFLYKRMQFKSNSSFLFEKKYFLKHILAPSNLLSSLNFCFMANRRSANECRHSEDYVCIKRLNHFIQIFGLLFPTVEVMYWFWQKNGLDNVLGDFFSNSSGHPGLLFIPNRWCNIVNRKAKIVSIITHCF
jgi:hypothetical protein